MRSLDFDIYGIPETQGSSRAFVRGGRAVVTSANMKLRPWREQVTAAAMAAKPADWVPLDGAVRLEVEFYLPRPTSAPKTRDTLPIRGKDLDKMLRAIGDSLTNAAVIVDDSRITDIATHKRFAVGAHLRFFDPEVHRPEPGARVLVSEIISFTRAELLEAMQ